MSENIVKWKARNSRVNEKAWGVCIDDGNDDPRYTSDWIIRPTEKLTTSDVALIVASHNAHIAHEGQYTVHVQSLVNPKLEPIVQISVGVENVQLPIRNAHELVHNFNEAIEAAVSDAMLCRFIKDHVYGGRNEEAANHAIGHLLIAFRKLRASFDAPIESENVS